MVLPCGVDKGFGGISVDDNIPVMSYYVLSVLLLDVPYCQLSCFAECYVKALLY